MRKKQIKQVAQEFADQTMKQRSDDHDEDADEESIRAEPEGGEILQNPEEKPINE